RCPTPDLSMRVTAVIAVVFASSWPSGAACGEEPVSFRQEVMAVLSRGGCNQGACHGNLNGKGGLKLSLRGEAPDRDLLALTRSQMGRRINLQQREESLLLQKPSGRVAHEGGQRFSTTSLEYALLKRWLTEGARDDPPRQQVTGLVVEPK